MHIENATTWKEIYRYRRQNFKAVCIVLWRTKCRGCTIFHHFTRGQRPFGRILNSSILRSKQSTLELFDIIFEKGSSKGPSGKNIMKFCNFQRILDIYCQWLLKALSRQEKLVSIAYFVMVIIHTCFVFVLTALLSYFVCYVSMFLTLLFHNRLFWNVWGPGYNFITWRQVYFRFVPIYA